MDPISEEEVKNQVEFGDTPQGIAKRWKTELSLSDKGEKTWRKEADKIYKQYRVENKKANAFNILFPNTEILRAAVYSSVPNPDVRRRYRDDDPMGKLVSEVLSRSLSYTIDCTDFDYQIKLDVLDMLLAGRGLSREKYFPELVDIESGQMGEDGQPVMTQQLLWEKSVTEHIQWSDFRRGPGKTWDECPWIAFRNIMTYDMLVKTFGEELANDVQLNEPSDDEVNKIKDEDVKRIFKTAEVWEIWDKETKKVFFINTGMQQPLGVHDDPLNLEGFWPCPRPLRAIEDAETLVPTPLLRQYAEQADELNMISARRNKLIGALKYRGVYDATLAELKQLESASDNEFIPVANAITWADKGGFERAIWVAPIIELANCLKELAIAAEGCKAVIYEIVGISDILRGSSNANETAEAQGIKAQWGGLRLQNMQSEVSRYVRDLIRIKADVISGKFQQQTIQQMTMLPIPTEQEAQMQMMQYQQQAQMATQQGQQPPPPPEQPITWEQVMQVLRNDVQRTYKVDIETDSTIAASLREDMNGLQEVLTGLNNFWAGVAPLVQAGVMPVDAVKEITLTVARRSKMGSAVEDALEKMQNPPQQDPAAAQQAEMEQVKQMEGMKLENAKQIEAMKGQFDMQVESMKAQQKMQTDLILARIDSMTAVKVAEINAANKPEVMQ